ncbi:hypothetical protein M9H77_11619 [Catharanthus roseus]|uniref:Uncharacterized protein n=1 Tax=Catharanthus roseus TaxID=4058 RepID=A0ACC0BF15_CATRO|nr:hypothetical protein M9H77_11619 [Catharanthus roseus]
MGFSRNEEGMLVRGGQEDNDESVEDDEENEGQEAMNVDEEEKDQKMHNRSLKGNVQRSKRSLKTTKLYEDKVIKVKTLKTRRMLRDKNRSSDFFTL